MSESEAAVTQTLVGGSAVVCQHQPLRKGVEAESNAAQTEGGLCGIGQPANPVACRSYAPMSQPSEVLRLGRGSPADRVEQVAAIVPFMTTARSENVS